MTRDALYIRACMAAEAACFEWKAAHPAAQLVFHRITLPAVGVGRAGLIASLQQALALGVAGNGHARKLLAAINRAVDGEGTVMMAEYALEQVYGIRQALTRQGAN